jgi:hypothetical protein
MEEAQPLVPGAQRGLTAGQKFARFAVVFGSLIFLSALSIVVLLTFQPLQLEVMSSSPCITHSSECTVEVTARVTGTLLSSSFSAISWLQEHLVGYGWSFDSSCFTLPGAATTRHTFSLTDVSQYPDGLPVCLEVDSFFGWGQRFTVNTTLSYAILGSNTLAPLRAEEVESCGADASSIVLVPGSYIAPGTILLDAVCGGGVVRVFLAQVRTPCSCSNFGYSSLLSPPSVDAQSLLLMTTCILIWTCRRNRTGRACCSWRQRP